MALVLGLKIGDSFLASGNLFTVLDSGIRWFDIRRSSDGKVFKITDEKCVEVLDDILVSCGSLKQEKITRVVIEAPRSIKITLSKG